MPIRPQHRWLYPIDWPQITDAVRFGRAKGLCEHCGRPHGSLVYHLGDGRWWDEAARSWRSSHGRTVLKKRRAPFPNDAGVKATRVYLATAHLDHNPSNSNWRNLKAFCQRCHIIHDRPEHLRRRRLSFMMSRAVGDLFLGKYDNVLYHR
ncbi:hypothetical protein ELG79_36595 [Rhizobium leguminosarum]|uniref:hypothetical protein n=1 Tax=Rhizobium leguminosarum TaxID=384 RepID=UPI001030AE90|nr:hypothetical protein [Rhizobium leguminosarum]TBG08443.1 hypothetical protein ELG79_36595 [Rhizobium leguminosarum]